jgi:hypothetical protein
MAIADVELTVGVPAAIRPQLCEPEDKLFAPASHTLANFRHLVRFGVHNIPCLVIHGSLLAVVAGQTSPSIVFLHGHA